jgi:negative regulator of sigma E activity
MSDKSKQNISELMDGELSNDCSRFLLKRMQSDSALQASWRSYHMMRSGLQQDNDAPLMHNLGAQVVKELQQTNQTMVEAVPNRFAGWLKAVAGSAIAASVAWVAVLTYHNDAMPDADQTSPVYAKTSEQLINPPNAQVVRVEQPIGFTRYPSLTPQIQQYLHESNEQPQIPVYYNTEYANRLIIQSQQQNRRNTAED